MPGVNDSTTQEKTEFGLYQIRLTCAPTIALVSAMWYNDGRYVLPTLEIRVYRKGHCKVPCGGKSSGPELL